MTTFNITGSITTNDPISASYVAAGNIDGIVASSSVAVSASYAPSNGGGGINGMAYFTSSFTWTIPSGVTKVRVIAIGSGGGGGTYTGGGGGYAEGILSVEGTSSLYVMVGAAGQIGVNGSDGNDGGGHDSGVLSITGSGGGSGKFGYGGGGSGVGGSINTTGQYGTSNGGGWAGNLPWIVVPSPTTQYNAIGQGGAQSTNGQPGRVVIYY